MADHRWRRGHEELDAAGQDVLDGRTRALVGHMHHVRAGHLLEQFGADVRHGTAALRGIVDFTGVRLGIGDQLFQVMHGQRGVHRHDVRRHRHHAHRLERLGVPAQAVEHRRIAGVIHRVRRQQRIPVRLRGRHQVVGDVAAGAGPVVDDGRLAQCGRQRFARQARGQVHDAAGGHRHHDRDRVRREVLGGRQRRQKREREGDQFAQHGWTPRPAAGG
ncbi:hypothetical protein D3C85_931560 [compost metagenome]